MEKIISVNLAGRVLPIEEDAFVLLNHYFESLRTYFASTEGSEEIVGDIESRISEMLAEELRTGTPAISVLHVSKVKNRMGSVEDFKAADGITDSTASSGEYPKTPPTATAIGALPRFLRNSNDKMLGGVCSGIAAYFGIDPALVRVLFAVLALGGWGLGILLYIAIWAFTPEAILPADATGRKLYRNPESKWLGGVCAGLAAYFHKDVWIFRIVFFLPMLTGIGSGNSALGAIMLSGSFAFTILVIYILLWSLLPDAKTPLQKEEMRGERSNIQHIQEQVKARATQFGEEVKTSAQRFTAQTKERFQQGNWQGKAAARKGAHVMGGIFRAIIFFIGGLIAFSFLMILLGYFFGGFSDVVNGFLLDSSRQRLLVNSSLLLLLGAPFLALLLKIVSSALRLPASRFAGLTFTLLWIGGFVIALIAANDVLRNFRSVKKVTTEIPISQPAGGELTLSVPGEGIVYDNTLPVLHGEIEGWNVTPEEMSLGTVWISTEESPDSLFHLFVTRQSRGRNRAQAQRLATAIDYPIKAQNSQINLPAGFTLTRQQGFRGQMVRLRIQVPAGGKLEVDPSVPQKLIVGNESNSYFTRPNGISVRTGRRSSAGSRRYEMNEDGALEEWD